MTAWKVAPPLDVLKAEVDTAYPGRSTKSDGTIGDAAHSSRTSDHNPDDEGWVRARDITDWQGSAGAIAEHIRSTKDSRVKYVIWSGRMFSSYPSSGVPAWTWRKYSGPNGHFAHVHISLLASSAALDPRPWGFTRPTANKPAKDEPEMNAEERKLLEDTLAEAKAAGLRAAHCEELVAKVIGLHMDESADKGPLLPRIRDGIARLEAK